MSKNSLSEKSLLAEILLNLPFSMEPIKLKLLKGTLDYVINFFNFTSISPLKFLNKFDSMSDDNNFNR